MSSIMLADNAPVDPDDELLVAYLDGELDNKAREALEQRLMDEDSLRTRMQSLQSGWDWLDDLPDAAPSEKLVETTLELVVADIVKPKPQKSSVLSTYRWPLSIGLLSVIAVAGSIAVVYASRHSEYRRQLADLAIAEYLDAYDDGGDLMLMRELSADPSWNQMIAASRGVGDLQLSRKPLVADTPLEQRAAKIKEMSIDGRAFLASRWERFKRMDSVNRDRIRGTAAAVAVQPDPELLLQTMQSYSVWRESLPDDLRDQIESDDPQERRQAIARAVEATQNSVSRRSGSMLDDDTIERIYFVLKQILQRRLKSGDATISGFVELQRDRLGAEMADWLALRLLLNDDDFRGRRFPRPPQGGGPNMRPKSLTEDELQLIVAILSNSARVDLDTLSFGDPRLELTTLRAWAAEAVRRKAPSGSREETLLLDRYENVPAQERELLDLLRPKDILERLKPQRGLGPSPGRGPGYGKPNGANR